MTTNQDMQSWSTTWPSRYVLTVYNRRLGGSAFISADLTVDIVDVYPPPEITNLPAQVTVREDSSLLTFIYYVRYVGLAIRAH